MKRESHGPAQSLEMLRGLLATYVLIGHARWLLWAGHTPWLVSAPAWWEYPLAYGGALFRFGREAVLVFFALSGFFIHLSSASAVAPAAEPFSTARFYRRRAHRLVPPYVFALVATVVLDAIGRRHFPLLYAAHTGDALLDATMASGGFSTASVVPALFMLPSAAMHDFGSNGPLWSLAYEVVYYAMYPGWLWLRSRSWAAAVIAVPLVCVLGLARLPQPFAASVAQHYPIWIGGAVLAEAVRRLPRGAWPRTVAVAAGVIAFAAYLLADSLVVRVFAAVLFASATVYCFATLRFEAQPLSRVFAYLGTRSFSIYIMHFPFIALLSAAHFELYGARPLNGWLAVAGALLAIVMSCASFWACERHFLHRRPIYEESAAP